MVSHFRNRPTSQVTAFGSVHCDFELHMFDLLNKQSNFKQMVGNRDRQEL